MNTRTRLAAVGAALSMLLAGCSAANVEQKGAFTFNPPGGSNDIRYEIADRAVVGSFGGPALDGDGTISITDYRGQIVVVNVWGSWCGPCKEELPDLLVAHELTADDDVTFLGINVRETSGPGQDYVAAQDIPWRSISDEGMRTFLAFGGLPTTAVPTTLLIDRDQRVARIFLGIVGAQQLTEAIDELVAEGGTTSAASGEADPSSADPSSVDPSAVDPSSVDPSAVAPTTS